MTLKPRFRTSPPPLKDTRAFRAGRWAVFDFFFARTLFEPGFATFVLPPSWRQLIGTLTHEELSPPSFSSPRAQHDWSACNRGTTFLRLW